MKRKLESDFINRPKKAVKHYMEDYNPNTCGHDFRIILDATYVASLHKTIIDNTKNAVLELCQPVSIDAFINGQLLRVAISNI